ncbi:MAG: shikimate kinase [Cyanobium sp. CACIAM 14]|nr:MAG: shikimate kinase [Cyanobium sp. CACIAM 14]
MASDAADPATHRDLARRLGGLNIYLVGMMGAGKSAVGRPLAAALGYRFVDADRELETATRCSIAEIFASEGEEGFRAFETATLNALAEQHSLVVATGGGVVTRPENWGHMQQGVVVWLDAPEEELLRRLSTDPTPRPLLEAPDPAARLAALLAMRRPLYGQADLTVEQRGGLPEAVARQVLDALPSVLKPPRQAVAAPTWLEDTDGQRRQTID